MKTLVTLRVEDELAPPERVWPWGATLVGLQGAGLNPEKPMLILTSDVNRVS